MKADLELLCITVSCAAGSVLCDPSASAGRNLTDAEIVTLRAAQARPIFRTTGALGFGVVVLARVG
jgi:hypothetical protein